MQRPDRRQVRNVRHAKPLTGIVADPSFRAPIPHACQRQYSLALFSSTAYSRADACAITGLASRVQLAEGDLSIAQAFMRGGPSRAPGRRHATLHSWSAGLTSVAE